MGTTLYKLTDGKHQTRNETQWGEGVERTASGKGDLCGPGWLHAYEHPLLAALLHPLHVKFGELVLWECDGDVGLRERQIKCGCTRLKTLCRVPIPKVNEMQRVRFAIYCV